MFEEPCDDWKGVGSIAYDDFWSPCEKCGYSWRDHYEKKKREEKMKYARATLRPCSKYVMNVIPHGAEPYPPCANCGWKREQHSPYSEKENVCENYRPHINDPCMNCGKSAFAHRRQKPTEEKMNKLDKIVEKAKEKMQPEAQMFLHDPNLPSLLEEINRKILRLALTRAMCIAFVNGRWETTLFFRDRRNRD